MAPTRIEQRAALLLAIRQFFQASGVIEVNTPLLRPCGVTDPYLDNLPVAELGYLQTSPEYAMKILLAELGKSIYQICPAFRGGESGNRHRVEFQMLEWYRVGFSLNQLMDDLAALLASVSNLFRSSLFVGAPQRVTYRSLFETRYKINPHRSSVPELLPLCLDTGGEHLGDDASMPDCLDHLFTLIEKDLQAPTIVHEFPRSQAALAQTGPDASGDIVSYRFEFYVAGLEIANAYEELCDGAELRQRFIWNNERRLALGLPVMTIDEAFLAVADSVPACSGIALGVDRLLMALTGARDISDV